jgi:AcrR family transcriptional regulator
MASSARGKGRPKLTEAGEIDRAIREAALQVLLEHGEAATMNAVAVAAGISRKSLYARHPNKTELFLEAIRELLKPTGALVYDTSGTATERLKSYVEAALAVIVLPQSLTIQRLLTIDPAYIGAQDLLRSADRAARTSPGRRGTGHRRCRGDGPGGDPAGAGGGRSDGRGADGRGGIPCAYARRTWQLCRVSDQAGHTGLGTALAARPIGRLRPWARGG